MTRSTWFHVLIAVLCALAVVLFLRVRNASGAAPVPDGIASGHPADLASDTPGLKRS